MTARRVFLTDSFALNAGDAGILIAMVETLSAAFPGAAFSVESSHPAVSRGLPELAAVAVYPRIFDISALAGGWRARLAGYAAGGYDAVSFVLWAALRRARLPGLWLIRPSRRPQARALAGADTVVSVGGGFLSSHYLYGFRLLTYAVALLLGKPLVVYAQSVGPFDTRLSRLLVPWFLNRCALVTLREPDSAAYLGRFRLRVAPRVTADAAFLLDAPASASTPAPVVMFCVKRERGAAGARVHRAYVRTIRWLEAQGYAVELAAHTADGDRYNQTLNAELGGAPRTTHLSTTHPKSLKQAYGRCRFIIAARMHAIVFAAAQGVPFVALSYEPKFAGLLAQLGYDTSFCLDQLALSDAALEAAAMRMSEDHAAVAAGLRARLPGVLAAAGENAALLRGVLG
jgi:colanic acid/amylovoran biosynthesis protein